jgi:putative glycosyltransferase (TIGR04348 family)
VKILLVTPAPPRSRTGNAVTAARWARILRGLGHRVTVAGEYRGQAADALVALHARKSHRWIERFRRERPRAPLIVALTGTDLYRDLRRSARARRSLRLASRLVVLQPLALRSLPAGARRKTRVILQSAVPPARRSRPRPGAFEVSVVANLRAVKDPLRAARAARRLPEQSRVRVVHLGAAIDKTMRRRARREEAANPRYEWLGSVPRPRALRILARSRLLVLSSRLEGGANVVSEALVASVPVLASRIPGSVGLLGARYPGYFRVGDTAALARLLSRAESDRAFYDRLRRWCRRRRRLVTPAAERAAWRRLLSELGLNPVAARRAGRGGSPGARARGRRREPRPPSARARRRG